MTLIVFNICQAFGYYGFSSWAPTLLIEKGITITKSLEFSFIIAFAVPLAPLIAISYADKVKRKWIIVAAAFVIACAGYGFSEFVRPLVAFREHDAVIRVPCLPNRGLSSAHRAQAAGFVYSASRVGAMFSGFIVAFVLRNPGVSGVFATIRTAMLIVVFVISVFGPKTGNHIAA
ncbi:hypothetical protein ML401_35900 (plasmid) [Bradyrhizobium sp. 62B]|uniref:hypothetical protein n=1 Tax=Bradyrhizobium sp. 62B TaxID=2898442 RepID=UPI002557EFE1|nr:hypothetical protein ML401_35900 [Bradyrhizobium sp. 62B]